MEETLLKILGALADHERDIERLETELIDHSEMQFSSLRMTSALLRRRPREYRLKIPNSLKHHFRQIYNRRIATVSLADRFLNDLSF